MPAHLEVLGSRQIPCGPLLARVNVRKWPMQRDRTVGFDAARGGLKLTRFRGHLTVNEEGVRNANYEAAVSGGVPTADH